MRIPALLPLSTLSIGVLALTSCKTPTETPAESSPSETSTAAAIVGSATTAPTGTGQPAPAPHGTPEPTAQPLSLDDGKRWHANPETTAGVQQMTAIVTKAIANPGLNSTFTGAATKHLRDAYEAIFEKCTMTGAAHEQLHRFLVPLGPLFVELEESEGAAAATVLQNLNTHLAQYPQFFE